MQITLFALLIALGLSAPQNGPGAAAPDAAVVAARSTPGYRDVLARSVSTLLIREDYRRSGALLVTEMKAAIDQHDDTRLLSIVGVADAVYLRMFMAVSWNQQPPRVRESDPRDFMDNTGIGIGRSQKYGMTDPKEDHATFVSALVSEELFELDGPQGATVSADTVKQAGYSSLEEFRTNIRVTGYVRSQMAAGNFEPVIKYLHTVWLFGALSAQQGLLCHAAPPKIGFEEVRRQLQTAPAGTVAPVTVEIFRALEEANRFIVEHCHARERR